MIKNIARILRGEKQSDFMYSAGIVKGSKLASIEKSLEKVFNRKELSERRKKILFNEMKKKVDNFHFEKDLYEKVAHREMFEGLLKGLVISLEMVSCEVFVDKDLTHLVFLGTNGKSIALKKETDTEFPENPEMWVYRYVNLFEPFLKWFSTEEPELKDSKFFWFSLNHILEKDLIFENK